MEKYLIVVDMQNDFITGSLGSTMAQAIVPKIVDKLKIYPSDHIFATQDTHFDDYMESLEGKKLPVPHCIKDTEGWKIVSEIEKYITETNRVKKYTFGSDILCDTIYNIYKDDTDIEVELIGVCTDICVVSNALLLRAAMPNLKITVDPECCAGTSKENHDAALAVMRSCQIDVE